MEAVPDLKSVVYLDVWVRIPLLAPKDFIMELKDTVEGMLSSDYSERLRAEYDQASIRLEKLTEILDKYEDDPKNIVLDCPVDMLYRTKFYLELYRNALQDRLVYEAI